MRGVVLAAGFGSRLQPLTDNLPKTLLPVDGETTILDLILDNLAIAGVKEIALVVGHAAEVLSARQADLSARFGIDIQLVVNDRVDRNNCYSLWLAREYLADGAIVVNGDTVHPPVVEQCLLDSRGPGLLLALDGHRPLTEEAMKVRLGPDGRLHRITKNLPVDQADGEYPGICLVEPEIVDELASALEETWRRTPDGYYEDGFQLLADSGADVRALALPEISWVEVDDHRDLATARELACRY